MTTTPCTHPRASVDATHCPDCNARIDRRYSMRLFAALTLGLFPALVGLSIWFFLKVLR